MTTNELIRDLVMNFIKKYKELDAELKRKKFAITIGDELPAGIIQMAKVYIAKKRKIGVGDKMAVVTVTRYCFARVVRQEEYAVLEDGTPVISYWIRWVYLLVWTSVRFFEAVLGTCRKEFGREVRYTYFDGANIGRFERMDRQSWFPALWQDNALWWWYWWRHSTSRLR